MSTIIIPDGNLNGGDLVEIVNNTAEVCEALDLAIRRAEAVFPHPRDYQNSPDGTHQAHAVEAHRRLARLRELYLAYCADLRAVYDVAERSTASTGDYRLS